MSDRDYHHGNLEQALVEQSLAMVREHGLDKFSLRGAARAVGVDPAAAYRHFPNKAALLAAVASRVFSLLAERMEQQTPESADPEKRLRAIGAAYVHFAVDEPELFRLAFGPFGSGSEHHVSGVGPGGRNPYELLLDALAGLHRIGRVRHPPARAAISMWCAVHGLAHLAVDGNIDCDPIDVVITQVLDDQIRGVH